MTIEERVLEKLRHMPEAKKAEALRLITSLEIEARHERAAASMRWIREHRAEYAGRWVALDGDRLVASGTSAKVVYETARREGVDVPFLHQVEPEHEDAFWGGWL